MQFGDTFEHRQGVIGHIFFQLEFAACLATLINVTATREREDRKNTKSFTRLNSTDVTGYTIPAMRKFEEEKIETNYTS